MKWTLLLILLLTCKVPQPLYRSDPDKELILNKIKIKGDSNVVEINFYMARPIKRDSL